MAPSPRKADITHSEPGAIMRAHKPEYSDMCEICGPKIRDRRLRTERAQKIHAALVKFGYSNLSLQDTLDAYDIAIAGDPPASAGIIVRLVRTQLREANIV